MKYVKLAVRAGRQVFELIFSGVIGVPIVATIIIGREGFRAAIRRWCRAVEQEIHRGTPR